jgi:hypothetical protein
MEFYPMALFRLARFAVLLTLIAALGACAQAQKPAGPVGGHSPITSSAAADATSPEQRRALLASAHARLIATCDSVISRMGEATDAIQHGTKDPSVWAAAASLKVSIANSVVNIASQNEPDVGLLNITVMLTLESLVYHAPQPDGRTYAEATFGPSSKLLLDTLDDMQRKAWKIDADYYAKSQLDSLDAYLSKWIARHPDAHAVADVRLDSLADVQGQASVAHTGGGLSFPTIINIDQATRSVDQVRRLGESALFVSQRMPTLLRWQAELLALNLANQPSAQREMAAVDDANATLAKITPDLKYFLTTVPATLDKLQPEIHNLVTTLPATLKDSQPLVDKLQLTTADIRASLVTIDDISKRFGPVPGAATQPAASQPAGEPFSIEKYSQAAAQLADTAKSLRELVDSSDKMLETPAWAARFKDINGLTEGRIKELDRITQERVDHIYTRCIEAILVLFGCLVVYRVIATKMLPHRAAKT